MIRASLPLRLNVHKWDYTVGAEEDSSVIGHLPSMLKAPGFREERNLPGLLWKNMQDDRKREKKKERKSLTLFSVNWTCLLVMVCILVMKPWHKDKHVKIWIFSCRKENIYEQWKSNLDDFLWSWLISVTKLVGICKDSELLKAESLVLPGCFPHGEAGDTVA